MHRHLEFLGLAEGRMQHVIQPSPLESRGADGLGLISCEQEWHLPAAFVETTCQLQYDKRFEWREILHLIHGDTAEVKNRSNLLCRPPQQRLSSSPCHGEFGEVSVR